jgi:6-phosphofructokinase 1
MSIKRIAIFTSGGDAPGMNAGIRAVTRTAIYNNVEVLGINYGYQGMIENDFRPLASEDVSGIIQLGGTILMTARSKEFLTYKGREKAFASLKKNNIDGVIVIGGDGSFRGATRFSEEFNIPFIGMPGTIDNDISGTDYTIGYDTALNTLLEAVDKIKDTASSHGRIFFVETMGREAGLLALEGGIACGAEVILIPEMLEQENELERFLLKDVMDKKTSGIVMVAEGDEMGGALEIARKVRDKHNLEVRVSILGHIQRGGSPTAKDRVAATRMGVAAVRALLAGKRNLMIGFKSDEIVEVPFGKTAKAHRPVKKELTEMVKILNGILIKD